MTPSTRPRIPRGEFGERRTRLRNAMKSEGIDLFIAYADDRATYGQQHARYLFDYQPHFEPALVIVPAGQECVHCHGSGIGPLHSGSFLLPGCAPRG